MTGHGDLDHAKILAGEDSYSDSPKWDVHSGAREAQRGIITNNDRE